MMQMTRSLAVAGAALSCLILLCHVQAAEYAIVVSIKDVELVDGEDLNPVITDDFVLIPNPRTCDPAREYRLVFRAVKR